MLDYLILDYLEKHETADEFHKTKRLHFKDRLSRFEQCVRASRGPSAAETVAGFVARVEPLRQLRNHLAHGTMVFRSGVAGGPVLEVCLPAELDNWDSPESRHLELGAMEIAFDKLTELIEELQRLIT